MDRRMTITPLCQPVRLSEAVNSPHASTARTESPRFGQIPELAPSGITVNAVAPGFIQLDRHADVPAGTVDAYPASVPVGRMGAPEDVAHAVSFLASAGAGLVTGQRILVDGGRALGLGH
jgi:NAD(P)-dependent dehydrogenase (short-subunit alcohol dehydrogenase family)